MKSGPTYSLFLILIALVVQSGPAHAYLDPGTGSIMLQMLLGGVAGGAVVLRLYWARIKDWFSPGEALASEASDDETKPGDS